MHRIGRFATTIIPRCCHPIGVVALSNYRPRARSRWRRPDINNERFSFPISSLASAITIAGATLVQAETTTDVSTLSSEDANSSTLVQAETTTDVSTLSSEDTNSSKQSEDNNGFGNDSREERNESYAVLIWRILTDLVNPCQRALMCGIVGINLAVISAFELGFFFSKPPNRKPALLRFMSKNFTLSQGWLRNGRWHVLLTSIFAHADARHVMRNSLLTCLAVIACSQFLTATQMAAIYMASGVIGGSASISLCTWLRKTRYMGEHIGGSDGVYGLAFFVACAQDTKTPLETVMLKGMMTVVFVNNIIGFRKFLRYGFKGEGANMIHVDHTSHLLGSLTGVAAYWMTRTSNSGDEKVEVAE